jgi:hypothetical protein
MVIGGEICEALSQLKITRAMNIRICFIMLFCFVGGSIAKSNIFTWANTNGGDWNVATNWSPNQVPAPGDDVIITNSGTYTVTNNSSATLGNLTLGSTNGIQTLILASLTLNNAGLVSSNGVLYWNSGTINGSLTLAPGGVLNITNATTYSIFGSLTNNGTVNWSVGNLYGYGPPSYSGQIYNAGLWNAQFDGTLTLASGTPAFINVGIFRKSGGTGITSIGWNFSSTGTFDVQTGSLSASAWVSNSILHGYYVGAISVADTNATVLVASNAVVNWTGGTVNGTLTVAPGGMLDITNNTTYSIFGSLTNNGTVNWSSGSIYGYGPPGYNGLIYNTGLWDAQFDGSLTAASGTPAFINAGTFRKSGGTGITYLAWNFSSTGSFDVQTGSLSCSTWAGNNNTLNGNYTGSGTINSGVSLTVASNAVYNWNSGEIDGSLTVAPGGLLNITNNTTYTIFGSLTNNGTVNWSSGSIYGYGPPSYNGLIYNAGLWDAQFDGTLLLASGTPAFINAGTFRKSGGTGTTTIGWDLTSTGSFDIQTGSLSTSAWVGNNILNGGYTGSISVNTNTTITVPASVTVNWTGGTIAAGGVLNVASNGIVNWGGGEVDGSLIVAKGGVLSITNNTTYSIFGALTNNGTVNWSAGNLYGYGPPSYNGLIYNAGLWNAQFDGSLTPASGTPAFINVGTFRKSGGTGTTSIGWSLTSTGTFDSQTGALSCSTWMGNNTLNGNYTGSSTLNSGVVLTVASNAFLNWNSGEIDGSLTVASGGSLNITNATTYSIFGSLTNNGTVNWSAGNLYGYGPPSYNGLIYNAGLWNAQFDGSLTLAAGTPAFFNTGIFRKSGGSGITYIYWNFTNNIGVLDAQTNNISLIGNYDLTGGTMNFGINNLTNYGTITLAGAAPLTGTVSATLNNGYIPIGGNSFTNLFYGSFTGVFTNAVLPFADAWSTNYQPTYFVLNVLNARPILTALATNTFTVNELTSLTVTNNATDADVPPQTLTYSLAAGLSGMLVNPFTGVFTWTPQQTNSPATNTVAVAVTDNGTPPLSATNTYTVIVKEVNVPASLPTIATQNVNELTLLTVANGATNFNIHSTIAGYTLVNPPANMVISAGGIITWTPAQTQSPSTNLITTIVTNSNPYDLVNPRLTSTNQFTVIVKEVNVPAALPTIATQVVNELTPLTVTSSATNFNIHSTIAGYALLNPPTNMVISASGIITWTPAQTQSPGTNLITAIVTNSNPYDLVNPQLTSTNQFTVIVKEVNVPATLPVIATQTNTLLKLFSITNSATEPNLHSLTGNYQLLFAPAGAAINNSGVITWTPVPNQSLTTNTITTVVTNSNPYDLVNPHLAATNSFSVIVVPNTMATNLTTLNSGGTNLTLSWPADHTGWRLEIQTNTVARGIGSNWVAIIGSVATNQVVVPIAQTNGAVFLRMIYP